MFDRSVLLKQASVIACFADFLHKQTRTTWFHAEGNDSEAPDSHIGACKFLEVCKQDTDYEMENNIEGADRPLNSAGLNSK